MDNAANQPIISLIVNVHINNEFQLDDTVVDAWVSTNLYLMEPEVILAAKVVPKSSFLRPCR